MSPPPLAQTSCWFEETKSYQNDKLGRQSSPELARSRFLQSETSRDALNGRFLRDSIGADLVVGYYWSRA